MSLVFTSSSCDFHLLCQLAHVLHTHFICLAVSCDGASGSDDGVWWDDMSTKE